MDIRNKIEPGFYKEQQIEALANMDYISWNKCKKMLESPRAFFRHYAGKIVTQPTKAMEFGHLVHMAALEPKKFRERYKIMPKFVGLTKDGKESDRSAEAKAKKEAWIKAQPDGTVVVTEEEMDALIEMVDNLMDHDQAMKLLSGGIAEGWGYAWDENFGRWMLVRTDFITQDLITVELKTTSKQILTPRAWAREAFFQGYHGQLAHNARGVGLLHGIPENRRGAWVVIQSVPPYDVAVFTAHESVMLAGEDLCFKAYHQINEHLEIDPRMQNRKMWNGKQKKQAEEVLFEPWMLSTNEVYDDTTQTNQP